MCAKEALKTFVQDESVKDFDSILKMLNSMASKSRTSCLWLDAFVWPVILIMRFVRAGREAD